MLSPVRLSHGWISQKTAEIRIMKFSPYGSPIYLYFLQGKFRPEIPAGSPGRGGTMEGREKEPFFRFTRQYLANGTRYIQSYC